MSLRRFLDKRTKKRSGKVDTSTPEEPAHSEPHRSSSPGSELTVSESSRPENDDIWVQADKSLRENTKTAEVLENAARILQKSGLICAEESAQRHLQLCNFLNDKSCALEDRKWIVGEWKPASRIKLTKIFQNILMVKDIITSAASASPPAAIACAGLIVALTLFIQAKEEKGSLLQGLEKTAALTPRLYEMQKLYLSSDLHANLTEGYMSEFRKSLTDLCSNVLEFHARALCYLDKGSVSQTLRSMFKQDPWGDLIKNMDSSEIEAGRFIGLIDAADMNIKWQKWNTRDEELQKKTEAQQVWRITQDRDKKIAELLRVLYTCPYRDRKDRNSERVPGTCEWFTGHKLFQNWDLSCVSCLLWASADPGCGKSVLAKYLIDSVLPRNDRIICYFFFKDDLADQRTATGALSSLLRQLIIARPSLLTDSVLQTANIGGGNLLHSFLDLWSILMSLAENSKTEEIVFVVDALDECCDQERNTFLSAVTSLYLEPYSTHAVKFLLTSRPYGHIRSAFRELQERLPTIHLSGESGDEAEQMSREINLVIEHLIEVLVKEKDLHADEHQLLREELKPIHNRTYLWVTLTLGFIKEDIGFTKGKVRQTLRNKLPHTVNEAYEKILNRSPDQERARLFLQIILAAKRPLSLEELSVAEALKRARQSNQEVLDDIEPVERFKNTVRDICGLLLWISDGKVYLLHQTVKEFLVPSQSNPGQSKSEIGSTWQSSLAERDSERILAERCVWLLASDLEGPTFVGFLAYAASYWDDHLRVLICSDANEELVKLCIDLCTSGSTGFARWFKLDRYKKSRYPREDASPLIMASYLGIEFAVQELLHSPGINLERTDSWSGQTPISWASKGGRANVVKLLIETGKVEIDPKDKHEQTPLSYASQGGHTEVVRLLLETGKVEVEWKSKSKQWTPLLWASQNGYTEVVKLLLDTGQANVNARCDRRQKTPLLQASKHGFLEIVKLLLETGEVEVDSKDGDQRTSLSHASGAGHTEVVKLLLATGKVEIDIKDKYQRTPLSHATVGGWTEVVKILLETGQADIESKNRFQRTPFLLASLLGRTEVVKLLLETGNVDINARDRKQRTALCYASGNGYPEIVKLLLETGLAEIDTKDEDQRTPLAYASRVFEIDPYMLMTDEAKETSTPMRPASKNDFKQVVDLLLGAGATPVALADTPGYAIVRHLSPPPNWRGRR